MDGIVTHIINRLERIRFLRNLAETDPLTKLANRQRSIQDLDTQYFGMSNYPSVRAREFIKQ